MHPTPQTPRIKNKQWLDNVTHKADQVLHEMDTHYATLLCKHDYTPRIKNLSTNADINEQHIMIKQCEFRAAYRKSSQHTIPPATSHPINIPTPELLKQHNTYTSNTMNEMLRKDEESRLWKQNAKHDLNIPYDNFMGE